MKKTSILNKVNFFFLSIFIITQITGILLSLTISFILRDFTWQFIHAAVINSFVLGIILTTSCSLAQRLVFRVPIPVIGVISFLLLTGVSIISLIFLLVLEPALFVYYNRGAVSFIFINYLFVLALQTICIGSIIYKELMFDKEKIISNERILKNQIEMQLLSSRINPHFLFNTLNMILTLLKKPDKAEIAILNLSDLLRENLDISGKNAILITEEIDNVRKYLEIQKLRFNEKLNYTISCNTVFSLPPLIIQPLVENSIKHNIQKVEFLNIDIIVTSDKNRHTIVVIDSEKAITESMLNTGQGLTITKKRVENSKGTFSIVNGGIEITFNV